MGKGPDCYKCKYREDSPGSAHSSCVHPAFRKAKNDGFGGLMAIFASVGREHPVKGASTNKKIVVVGAPHGIAHGWFNHPWDFDPTWLEKCTGFKAIKKKKGKVKA